MSRESGVSRSRNVTAEVGGNCVQSTLLVDILILSQLLVVVQILIGRKMPKIRNREEIESSRKGSVFLLKVGYDLSYLL